MIPLATFFFLKKRFIINKSIKKIINEIKIYIPNITSGDLYYLK